MACCCGHLTRLSGPQRSSSKLQARGIGTRCEFGIWVVLSMQAPTFKSEIEKHAMNDSSESCTT